MKYIYLPALLFAFISCSRGQNENIKNVLDSIDDWNVVAFKRTTADTLKVGNWIPDPEISATIRLNGDSSCLNPRLDFYPISSKNYVKKKLMTYLTLRGSLFPPQPNIYSSKDYYLLIWDFTDYDGHSCCKCDELEAEIISRLNLTTEWTLPPSVGNPSK